jgi:thiol-disulfide isomerase/thioredoxin
METAMMTRRLLALALAGTAGLFGFAAPAIGGDLVPHDTMSLHADARQQAPDFVGLDRWFNSEPLSIRNLRGKVVLVNFWTYGCINCVHTLPHVTQLYAKYKDRGFVVIGIHTPEFPFERSAGNVQTALKRHGIAYPVAQDNDSRTWNAYSNQYWPAQYIVDRSGNVIYQHAGEGQYDEMDRIVARLLEPSS